MRTCLTLTGFLLISMATISVGLQPMGAPTRSMFSFSFKYHIVIQLKINAFRNFATLLLFGPLSHQYHEIIIFCNNAICFQNATQQIRSSVKMADAYRCRGVVMEISTARMKKMRKIVQVKLFFLKKQ